MFFPVPLRRCASLTINGRCGGTSFTVANTSYIAGGDGGGSLTVQWRCSRCGASVAVAVPASMQSIAGPTPTSSPALRSVVAQLDQVASLDRLRPAQIEALAAVAENTSLRQRVEQLEDAVSWALGERGTFPPRAEGDGPYWWRGELRRRSEVG